MFDHVEFSVADISASRAFYGGVVKALGGSEIFFDVDGKELGLGVGDVVHLLLFQAGPTQPRMHICLTAQSKEDVVAAHQAALAAGGSCNGPPGYRDHYGPGYFAAFMHDADGHNIEALYREPLA
ncbi:MAG: VOC family protein [Pseudomonadota bacterium]